MYVHMGDDSDRIIPGLGAGRTSQQHEIEDFDEANTLFSYQIDLYHRFPSFKRHKICSL